MKKLLTTFLRSSVETFSKTIFTNSSQRISFIVLCLMLAGTLTGYNAKAQCPTGTAPYVSVTAPTTSTITTTSAILSTNWAAWSGGFGITVYIEYGTTSGSYTNSVTYTQASWTSGTSGTYAPTLTGLTAGTTYYARARIVGNMASYTCISSPITFTTVSAGPFVITTTTATSVTANTASTGGNITLTGAVTVVQRGVAYGTATNPTTAGASTNDGSGSGSFPSNLTGLTPSTLYYVRAYAIGSDGITYYGPNQSFTTMAPFIITTTAASSITGTTATTGGNITLNGGITVTQRGVAYGTTANPTTAGSTTNNGSGVGAFTSNLTGLTSSTTYYVRAYVIGSNGVTYYGPQQTFTTLFQVSGIVSPYSLTPAWHFGTRAKYTFPSGSFPAVPPGPTVSTVTPTTDLPETSTSISFRNGNTAIYTNSMIAVNGGNAVQRTFASDVAGSYGYGTCAGSSTGGGVSFPDPANNATNDAFYMILGNDITGGGCDKPSAGTGTGINQYRFTGTGTTVAYNSGQVRLAERDWASEAIAAGTDGDGGYWVVAHSVNATNEFRVWHYTASGVSGPVSYTPTKPAAAGGNTTNSGGYLKFSPCMDKLAFTGFLGTIIVYDFDRTTGAIGAQRAVKGSIGHSVGIEFSPDGNKIYYSGQGSAVSWFLISNPATGGTIAGSTSWTMQMGPDAQIYTSGGGGSTVGVITDPNSASAGHTPITLGAGSSTYRGLSNIAWLSPQRPTLTASVTDCNVDFKYSFLNYFNDTVTTNNIEWSWDNGSTWAAGTNPQSHTFPTGTNYNVRVRFKDAYCNQDWSQSITGSVTCTTLPVEWLDVSARGNQHQVLVNWSTSIEKNNAYFIVERSADGNVFTPIGRVNGSGNSSGMKQYEFTDINPLNGINYYRIVQYDYDNNSSYSNTVSSSIQGSLYVTISPNPSQNDFQLNIFSIEKEIHIVVTDVLGREIYNTTTTDLTSVRFGENFAKGTYIVRVIGGEQVHTQKIIKQ